MNGAMNNVKDYVGSQKLNTQTFLTGIISSSIKKLTGKNHQVGFVRAPISIQWNLH